MKKDIRTLAALLIASATFVACTSDDNIIDEPQQASGDAQQTYTMTVEATKDPAATTRTLTLDESGSKNTLNATWAEGDAVTVYNVTRSADLTGTLTAQSSGATTVLKGELTGSIQNGDQLKLKFLSPSYSSQGGTLEYIATHCDYAEATVTVTDASTPSVTTTAASFTNQQAIVKFALKNEAGDAGLFMSELKISDGTHTYTVNRRGSGDPFYVAIPGFSGKTIRMIASYGTDVREYTKSGVSFTNGQYYEITVKMLKSGALSSMFSVSSTQQVYFSKGNLQYQGSTNSWRFATHQYDYIGNNAGNTAPSASQTAWMDLFGWGTSGWDNGNRNAYQPYSTSTDVSDYGVKNPKSADETLTGEYANGDWGVYNSAQLGFGWRTMTRDEWRYLIYYRTTTGTVNGTSNAIYTEAKILTDGSGTDGLTYNICGVILFPDEFDGSASYSGVTWGTINNVSDWSTTCTTAGWKALEAAGCVFLPAAGNRSGTSVTSAGTYGTYWTSTASAVEYVDDLWIGPSTFSAFGGNYRHLGRSVRLVRNVD